MIFSEESLENLIVNLNGDDSEFCFNHHVILFTIDTALPLTIQYLSDANGIYKAE